SHDRDLRHARLRNRWMRIAVRATPCSLADFPPADRPGAASLTTSQDQVPVAKAARVTATTMPAGQPAELTSPSPKHVTSPHAPYLWVTRRPRDIRLTCIGRQCKWFSHSLFGASCLGFGRA